MVWIPIKHNRKGGKLFHFPPPQFVFVPISINLLSLLTTDQGSVYNPYYVPNSKLQS